MFAEHMKTPVADAFMLKRRRGDVGIELECEGRELPGGVIHPEWQGKADGSLRNGMEYVSTILDRKNVRKSVTGLNDKLKHYGATVQPTYRCSTHIHENYLDCTFSDVIGTYVCWSLIEPTVFRLLPAGRDGSLFCVSSYDSGDLPAFLERFCENIAAGNIRGGFRMRGKYASLNITRLAPGDAPALGTLEYRVFPLSMDPEQVQEWADMTGNIKSFVQRHGAEDPSYLSMVRWAESNPVEFIKSILGKCPVSEQEAAELVDFGARQAYELARITMAALNAKPKPKEKAKSKYVLDWNGDANAVVGGGGGGGVGFIDALPPEQPMEVAPAQPAAPFPGARAGMVGEVPARARVRAGEAAAGGRGADGGGLVRPAPGARRRRRVAAAGQPEVPVEPAVADVRRRWVIQEV